MYLRSDVSFDTEAIPSSCPFCQETIIKPYTLKETAAFHVVADHAPLLEGHILIIPKRHFACYGAMPSTLDAELIALKQEVQTFLTHYYAPTIFWEHGVFRQTVFHAHLHCFPFGTLHYDAASDLHALIVQTQDDLRTWYTTQGHYLYLHDSHQPYLFPPRSEVYQQIAQQILRAGVMARNPHATWRNSLQRREEGEALIAATMEKWHIFQQQGVYQQ